LILLRAAIGIEPMNKAFAALFINNFFNNKFYGKFLKKNTITNLSIKLSEERLNFG